MKISVVIPAHNSSRWLGETLESIRAQSVPLHDLEILLVDDASDDDTADVAAKFFNDHDLRGEVIRLSQNRGASWARNVGWRAATAPWIQFVDADDLLAASKLEIQGAALRDIPDDIAVVYSRWQHMRQLASRWCPAGPVVDSFVDHDPVSAIIKDDLFGYVGPTLVRRTALERVDGFSTDMTIGEDLDLMLRMAMAGFGFRRAPYVQPTFYYRDTPGSLWRTSSTQLAAVTKLLYSLKAANDYLEQGASPPAESTRRAMAARYVRILPVLEDQDPAMHRTVITWISSLDLISGPVDSHLAVRAAAPLLGLGNALRLRSWVRNACRKGNLKCYDVALLPAIGIALEMAS